MMHPTRLGKISRLADMNRSQLSLFVQNRSKQSKSISEEERRANLPTYQFAKEGAERDLRLYVWGFAMYGALGKPLLVKPEPGRRKVPALHNPVRMSFAYDHDITDVACGYGFTVLSANSKTKNKVFGTGVNADSQIGYHYVRRDKPLEFLLTPNPIAVPFDNPKETQVTHIACGRSHTIIATDNEGIFSLGNNCYGQCGRPIVENEKYSGNSMIHKVRFEKDKGKIKQIVCGPDHTMFLTEDGKVFSCGWGADGQTGIGSSRNVWLPEKVVGDIEGVKIVNLSSAGDVVLAVSDQGDVFGWGNSEYRQLGYATDQEQLAYSKHMPLKGVGKIVDVAAAGTMCAVLNDAGQVFVWGYGILGLGPEVQERDTAEMLPETLFGRNDFNPDVKVKSINCGLSHFAAITSKGDLFMWGKNNKHCLGLGTRGKDQFFPLRVNMPAEVQGVRCGVDHTYAICKAFC